MLWHEYHAIALTVRCYIYECLIMQRKWWKSQSQSLFLSHQVKFTSWLFTQQEIPQRIKAAMVRTVWCIWQHVGWHAEAHVLIVFLYLWFVLLPLPWCSLVKKLPHSQRTQQCRTVLVSFTSQDVYRHSNTRFEFECEI